MYFWTPHWAQSKYDLTMVQLPEVDVRVRGRRPPTTRRSTRARYPPDPLYKAFNADLQTEGPGGVRVPVGDDRTRTTIRTAIALDINDGTTPDEAAQKWIDANPDIWQPWVDAGLAAQG